jgi:cholesterol transport system auxiliary component
LKRIRAALLAFCVVAASGCTLNAPARTAPAVYDLGGYRGGDATKTVIPEAVTIPPVASAPWLESTSMVYRLSYDDANRLRAYSESRWAASPAMLLTEELRSRFASAAERVSTRSDGAEPNIVLRVALEDFTQSFDAAERSRVVVRARASLVDGAARNIVAQHTFRIEHEAQPNAAGAAAAFSRSSAQLVDELLDWAAQNLKNMKTESTARRSVR